MTIMRLGFFFLYLSFSAAYAMDPTATGIFAFWDDGFGLAGVETRRSKHLKANVRVLTDFGGKVDPNETVPQAALREFMEETAYTFGPNSSFKITENDLKDPQKCAYSVINGYGAFFLKMTGPKPFYETYQENALAVRNILGGHNHVEKEQWGYVSIYDLIQHINTQPKTAPFGQTTLPLYYHYVNHLLAPQVQQFLGPAAIQNPAHSATNPGADAAAKAHAVLAALDEALKIITKKQQFVSNAAQTHQVLFQQAQTLAIQQAQTLAIQQPQNLAMQQQILQNAQTYVDQQLQDILEVEDLVKRIKSHAAPYLTPQTTQQINLAEKWVAQEQAQPLGIAQAQLQNFVALAIQQAAVPKPVVVAKPPAPIPATAAKPQPTAKPAPKAPAQQAAAPKPAVVVAKPPAPKPAPKAQAQKAAAQKAPAKPAAKKPAPKPAAKKPAAKKPAAKKPAAKKPAAKPNPRGKRRR